MKFWPRRRKGGAGRRRKRQDKGRRLGQLPALSLFFGGLRLPLWEDSLYLTKSPAGAVPLCQTSVSQYMVTISHIAFIYCGTNLQNAYRKTKRAENSGTMVLPKQAQGALWLSSAKGADGNFLIKARREVGL